MKTHMRLGTHTPDACDFTVCRPAQPAWEWADLLYDAITDDWREVTCPTCRAIHDHGPVRIAPPPEPDDDRSQDQ